MTGTPDCGGNLGPPGIRLDEDWQVHSTFSDGTGTIEENVEAAAEQGLRLICLTDHVRHDTSWVPDFVVAARRVGVDGGPLTIRCGLEAKILDTQGRLDLPPDHALADLILAADHQVPTPAGPRSPQETGAAIAAGELTPATVVDWIEAATIATMAAHPGVLIAHLFSVLPKVGLSEADVSDERIARLAEAALRHRAIVEVSERWSCPTLRTMRMMLRAGVHTVASTDSHRPQDIGRYNYCRTVAAAA